MAGIESCEYLRHVGHGHDDSRKASVSPIEGYGSDIATEIPTQVDRCSSGGAAPRQNVRMAATTVRHEPSKPSPTAQKDGVHSSRGAELSAFVRPSFARFDDALDCEEARKAGELIRFLEFPGRSEQENRM